MNKLLSILVLGMFLITLVSASYGEYNYGYDDNNKYGVYYEESGYTQQERLEIQNKFENRYQYKCKSNQTCYFDGSEEFENMEFKIREQRRFLFFNVEMKQEYILDANGEGEIVQVKRNLWSRLFGQEVIA